MAVIQWNDRSAVTVMSTLHHGDKSDSCIRHTKEPKYKPYKKLRVPRPVAIGDYNKHMGGVDKSDQMIKYYEVLHKSLKYWKKIFLHMIDMAVYNAFIMFTQLQLENRRGERLTRPAGYAQKDFRIELMRGLAGIGDDEDPPLYVPPARAPPPSPPPDNPPDNPRHSSHVPIILETRGNCPVCRVSGHYNRCRYACEQCNVPLCISAERDCFKVYHSDAFDCHV